MKLPSSLDVYQNQGVKARGNGMSQTTKKYLDYPVNQVPTDDMIKKGKKGGSKISRAIAMDYETYHKTKGR